MSVQYTAWPKGCGLIVEVTASLHGPSLQLQNPAAQVGVVLLKVADHVGLPLQ